MPDNQSRVSHYRVYLKMYGEMMQDLSCRDEYITKLIDNDKLDDFETALRISIEKSPKH